MFRPLMDALVRVEKRYAIGLLSLFLGVIGIYITLEEKRTELTLDIAGETNVLDVRAPMRSLSITYQGVNIAEKNLGLRILTIRLENTGEHDITQSLYDTDDVFGFIVTPGRVVETPRIVSSNSEYVARKLGPKIRGNDTIALSKVIFDRGAYAVLEVRVLHARGTNPTVVPIGKVAGVKQILVTRSWARNRQPGVFAHAFAGDIRVQAVRLISYTLGGVLILIIFVIIPSVIISEWSSGRARIRRRREIEPILQSRVSEPKLRQILSDLYEWHGSRPLIALSSALADEKALRRVSERLRQALTEPDAQRLVNDHGPIPSHIHVADGVRYPKPADTSIWRLIRADLAYLPASGSVEFRPGVVSGVQQAVVGIMDAGLIDKNKAGLLQYSLGKPQEATEHFHDPLSGGSS